MTATEIQDLIEKIDSRIEFLKQDSTVIRHAFAGAAYNHGPYFRKLEIRRLKARRKTLIKKLK
jgi:hypothetical protein